MLPCLSNQKEHTCTLALVKQSSSSTIICHSVVKHRHYCALWLNSYCNVVKLLCRRESYLPTGLLSDIENVKYQRLGTLTKILKCGDGIRNVYEWVQQTRQAGGFRGPVYGPILVEVECHNQQHTWYLENQIGSKNVITLAVCCTCYPGVCMLSCLSTCILCWQCM